MKLLLTSAGFTNDKIIQALIDLTDRPLNELKLVFIPTAANVEIGGKEWLITDLHRCANLGLKQVDIVDISALPSNTFLPRLVDSDIIFFGGGNTHYCRVSEGMGYNYFYDHVFENDDYKVLQFCVINGDTIINRLTNNPIRFNNQGIKIYPNPASELVTIETIDNIINEINTIENDICKWIADLKLPTPGFCKNRPT